MCICHLSFATFVNCYVLTCPVHVPIQSHTVKPSCRFVAVIIPMNNKGNIILFHKFFCQDHWAIHYNFISESTNRSATTPLISRHDGFSLVWRAILIRHNSNNQIVPKRLWLLKKIGMTIVKDVTNQTHIDNNSLFFGNRRKDRVSINFIGSHDIRIKIAVEIAI